jgi:hypothetical protein
MQRHPASRTLAKFRAWRPLAATLAKIGAWRPLNQFRGLDMMDLSYFENFNLQITEVSLT